MPARSHPPNRSQYDRQPTRVVSQSRKFVDDHRDQFGQLTVIRFRESDYGVPLSRSIFQFVPPKGVDVIGKPR